MADSMLPLPSVVGLDDLLHTARQGALAGNALDLIKDRLTAMKAKKYREALNAPRDRKLELMDELKAIEALAQDLLVLETQGEAAHEQILAQAGLHESAIEPAILKPEVLPQRKRSSRAKRAPAKK